MAGRLAYCAFGVGIRCILDKEGFFIVYIVVDFGLECREIEGVDVRYCIMNEQMRLIHYLEVLCDVVVTGEAKRGRQDKAETGWRLTVAQPSAVSFICMLAPEYLNTGNSLEK